MLPIHPSAIPVAKSVPVTPSRRRETWREALDDLGWLVLIVNLVWAMAIVFYLVLR